jgi:23S rRNA pseudoU1915 N3-methylase RlmH
MSKQQIKKEVLAIREELNFNIKDKTVIMSIDGKEYNSTNLAEGIQKLIEISREVEKP